MAEVILQIGDRQHRIACKDGTEEQVRRIASKLESRWASANRASGGNSAERSMLFVALMLADALDDAERKAAGLGAPAPSASPTAASVGPDLDALAHRLEAIAAALEKPVQSA